MCVQWPSFQARLKAGQQSANESARPPLHPSGRAETTPQRRPAAGERLTGPSRLSSGWLIVSLERRWSCLRSIMIIVIILIITTITIIIQKDRNKNLLISKTSQEVTVLKQSLNPLDLFSCIRLVVSPCEALWEKQDFFFLKGDLNQCSSRSIINET